MKPKIITPHESIQLHELLTFKNLCLTKSVTMSPLVSDKELKDILNQDATNAERHINELISLMQNSSLMISEYER